MSGRKTAAGKTSVGTGAAIVYKRAMSIKKSLAWMGIAQTAVFIMQFGASAILARYLLPHEIGVYAIGLATVALLSLLQAIGLQALIVRELELTTAIRDTAFTINAAISCILSVGTFLLSYAGGALFREEGVRQVLAVLAITPLFAIPSFLPAALLERDGKFRETSFAILVMNAVNACATVFLAMLGFSYMSLAYASVLSSASLSLMFIVFGRQNLRCVIAVREWRRIANFGMQMLAVSTLTTVSQRLCDLLLGRILGLSALGLYSRASGVNNMLWGNIHALASRVVFVDFARLHRSGVSLRERYIAVAAMVTAILWPAFAGLAVVAKPFLILVYGENWSGAALPLTYLAMSSFLLVAITMRWEVCTATGSVAVQTRVEAIRAPLSLALFTAACFISLEAAAASRILDAAIAYALYRPHLSRLTDTGFRDLRRVYAQSLLLTIGAVTPAGALVASTHSGTPAFAPLITAILFGIFSWASLLYMMRHPLSLEVIATVRSRIPRLRGRH